MNIDYSRLEPGWENHQMDYRQNSWRLLANEMRREIYNFGMAALRKSEVNDDGNVVMLVMSHGGTLSIFDGTREQPQYNWFNTEHRAYEFFSDERAATYNVLRWQGLRQCMGQGFATRRNIEKPLNIKDLEDWGWKILEIERINKFRTQSLEEYEVLNEYRGQRRARATRNPARNRFALPLSTMNQES